MPTLTSSFLADDTSGNAEPDQQRIEQGETQSKESDVSRKPISTYV